MRKLSVIFNHSKFLGTNKEKVVLWVRVESTYKFPIPTTNPVEHMYGFVCRDRDNNLVQFFVPQKRIDTEEIFREVSNNSHNLLVFGTIEHTDSKKWNVKENRIKQVEVLYSRPVMRSSSMAKVHPKGLLALAASGNESFRKLDSVLSFFERL